jgi:hypothetical protein
MLGARHTSRVAWRRMHAQRHYVGYVTIGYDEIRLAGHEQTTGIDVTLSIPFGAIHGVRVGSDDDGKVVGERAVVVDLGEDEPIYVRPLEPDAAELNNLAQRLRTPD